MKRELKALKNTAGKEPTLKNPEDSQGDQEKQLRRTSRRIVQTSKKSFTQKLDRMGQRLKQ